MSEGVEFYAQEALTSDLHNPQKNFAKKEIDRELRLAELDQENNIFEDSQQELLLQKCPKHLEEDLQFYCFNKEQFLCSECLVSGKYVGLEIANLRKAADKLKGKFNKFVLEAMEKSEIYHVLEQEIRNHEKEIEFGISTYEEEISKLFNHIRKKLNEKEQEMINNLLLIKQERINESKLAADFIQKYQKEIEVMKESVENGSRNLNELSFCKYYQEKNNAIQVLLNDKDIKAEDVREIMENQQLQDQMGLCKLQDDFKTIALQLDTLTAIEFDKTKQSSNDTKSRRISLLFANGESDSNILKESRDTLLCRSSTPSRFTISQKPTYLSEDLVKATSMPINTTNIFEKHLAKVHEIRRQTPKQDLRTESSVLSPETKKPEIRSSLMIEMKRNSINKKYSGLSLNDSSSILDAYKDNRNKNAESKTPKTFMFSSNLSPSNKHFGSDLTSNSYKIDSLLVSATTKASDKPEKIGFDSSVRYIKFEKNRHEVQPAELQRKNSAKLLARENESSMGLDIGRLFAKRKLQERTTTSNVNDLGMKKKLSNLSTSLFK